jgi:hypothetical protein
MVGGKLARLSATRSRNSEVKVKLACSDVLDTGLQSTATASVAARG